ncbi:hypothetical protein MgSA37_02890 [Mucilaginibacter gotjawali]|uniref:Uncharacterized protein n=1 Tax=Mucilaginibacter gotjawali TaxID=1550579 RepID=A0A0X8X2T8_9SPHI|nr:hypothetical protein MgSA37_02890 [Mucilaginibacter gotjawali]
MEGLLRQPFFFHLIAKRNLKQQVESCRPRHPLYLANKIRVFALFLKRLTFIKKKVVWNIPMLLNYYNANYPGVWLAKKT